MFESLEAVKKVRMPRRGQQLLTLALIGVLCGCPTFVIAGYGVALFSLLILICQNFKLFFIDRLSVRLPKAVFGLYILYILFFLLAANINGDAALKESGMNSLMVNYLTSGFILISISCTASDNSFINRAVTLIAWICLAGAAVTVLQFQGVKLGWGIWFLFNGSTNEALQGIAENLDKTGSQDVVDSVFCPGLVPTQVYNGYFLCACGFAPLYKFLAADKWKHRLFWGAGVALVIAALFCAQQRSAFFIFLMLMAVMCYTRYRFLTILSIIVVLIAVTWYMSSIPLEEFGRLLDFEDNTRERIYSAGFDFLSGHWQWGGRAIFVRTTPHGLSAHNIVFNAFIYSGICGAICILAIYIIMLWQCIRTIWNNLGHRFGYPVVFACALLAYNLISFTHNNSLVTGEPIIFIFYALLLQSLKLHGKKMHNME